MTSVARLVLGEWGAVGWFLGCLGGRVVRMVMYVRFYQQIYFWDGLQFWVCGVRVGRFDGAAGVVISS